MTSMFFYSLDVLTALFAIMICLFAVQSRYFCLLAVNYRLRELKTLIGEIVLLAYVAILTLIPITISIHRRYSIISVNYLDLALWGIGAFAILYHIYLSILKEKESYLAILAILLTLPINSEIFQTRYIFIYLTSVVILFFRLFILIKKSIARQRNELDAFSIKDGLDKLSCGIMFCDLNGYIFLTNTKMTELAKEFLDKELKDGNRFWESLEKCNIPNIESQIVEGDILVHAAKSAWRFLKAHFNIGNKEYIEIIAIDVAESIGAYYALEEENRKLEQQKKEIEKLAENIETLHCEKAYSRIRSRVHDVLGQRLTAIQRISQSEEDIDYNTLLFLSKDSVKHIKKKGGGNAKELFGEIYHYFYKVGLSIELTDELPYEEDIAFLFLSVLREACTNAIKHAEATRVFVTIERNETNYRIEITNNGESPKKGLQEGGGLFGIRNRIESAGGTLKVEVIPEFSLIITIERSEA